MVSRSSPCRADPHAAGQGVHDGAVVQGFGLRDGHVRQVAPRHRAQSLPGAHGFDEFYGIPPDASWDVAANVPQIMQTQSAGNIPEKDLIEKGPWIYQQKGNGPLQKVKPFTLAVRAEIDTEELVPRSIEFIKRQAAAGKPFFLYLPFSMGHAPNLPSKQFAGKSAVGQYGDKMMEGDYHVGQVLDTLKELQLEDNTIVVFASDNGPTGHYFMTWDASAWGCPTWETRARSAARWARRPKARSAPSRSSAGPARSSQARPRTPCSRRWISCRLSRPSSEPSCPRIVRSTAWTRRTCSSARARWATASRCSPSSARTSWPCAGSNGGSTSKT